MEGLRRYCIHTFGTEYSALAGQRTLSELEELQELYYSRVTDM